MTDKEYIVALTARNKSLEEELRRLYGFNRPFICGAAGQAGTDSLSEFVLVSPSYGAEGYVVYRKHKDYSKLGQ